MRKLLLRLYQFPRFRYVSKFFIHNKKEGDFEWVFVLGCYNSGTTLLADLIAAHPSVNGFPVEGVLLSDELTRPEDFGWTQMWSKCSDLLEYDSTLHAHHKIEMLMSDWSPWIDGNASIVVEKSIANLLRWKWLKKNFSSVRFVAVIRNGFAVSEGIRRHAKPAKFGNMNFAEGYPIEMCARQWTEASQVLRSVVKENPKMAVVKYEDFVEKPAIILDDIWQNLGVSKVTTHFDEKSKTLTIDNKKRSVIKNRNSFSINNLSSNDITTINAIIEVEMKEWGYLK